MTVELVEPILHAAIALALIAAYATLSSLGHPDALLLGALLGQLGALGVGHVARRVVLARRAPLEPPPPPPPVPPLGGSS